MIYFGSQEVELKGKVMVRRINIDICLSWNKELCEVEVVCLCRSPARWSVKHFQKAFELRRIRFTLSTQSSVQSIYLKEGIACRCSPDWWRRGERVEFF